MSWNRKGLLDEQSLISYKLRLHYAAILIKSASVALALSAGGAQANDGYFVIVASFPTDTSDAEVARQARDLAYVRATAARCHLHAYNDFAVKFGGSFRPGYIVFVLGDGRSFATPNAANSAARAASLCFPGAYVKSARNRASDQILDRRALVEGRKRSYHYRMTAITQEGKVGGMTPERKVMQLKSLDELADQLQTQDPCT